MMKRKVLILLIGISSVSAVAQSVDSATDMNGIILGTEQVELKDNLYLITGDEPAYKEAPSLQYALKRKIMIGIRDATYQGDEFRQFGKYQATNITMQFYDGKLFKVQWTFRSQRELEETYHYLVDYYADKFGSSTEEVYDDFRQVEWQGHRKYAQVFMDNEADVTLVFEDVKLSKKVQKALAKSK